MDIVFTPKRTLCAAIIASVALLTAHLCYLHYAYPYITADDAFISLRYAQRLLDGKGLTWNDGEYVEGYSNLLWVLSCAALAAIKIRLTATPELLGVGCTFLVLPVFWWHAAQAKLTPWAVLAGAIAFAMAAPVAVWALAGMETPMVMLFFAWVTALVYPLMQRFDTKYAAASGLLLGLICLLRPEGPVYTLSVASSLLVFSAVPIPRRIAMLTVLCGIPMVFFLSQLAFRLSYYGQWVSNTVMAKVAFTAGRLQTGFVYATDAIYFLLPMLLYTAINLWGVRRNPDEKPALRFILALLWILGCISLPVIVSGGDFFPWFRAFMPVFPLAVMVLMQGVHIGLKYSPVKKEMIFLGYIFACHLWLQYDIDTRQMPLASHWIVEARQMGLALKEKYGAKQPLIAVFAAGAIPYYSDLPSLDIFGLNDRYLTAHRSEDPRFGKGVVGHELFNGAYIASQKADILILDIPGFHNICSGFQDECAKLLPLYHQDILHIPGQDIRIWLRNGSDKI